MASIGSAGSSLVAIARPMFLHSTVNKNSQHLPNNKTPTPISQPTFQSLLHPPSTTKTPVSDFFAATVVPEVITKKTTVLRAKPSSTMARDNGKHGSYRHVSGSLEKQHYENDSLTESPSPAPAALHSPADSIPTPAFNEKLGRAKIESSGGLSSFSKAAAFFRPKADGPRQSPPLADDGVGGGGACFFDSVPSSLNAKYPIMADPGSVPRRAVTPTLVAAEDQPTWIETAILGVLVYSALFGFCFTIYAGVRDVVLYALALIFDLVAGIKGA